jgi:hypothetical protein
LEEQNVLSSFQKYLNQRLNEDIHLKSAKKGLSGSKEKLMKLMKEKSKKLLMEKAVKLPPTDKLGTR